ncbi:hypothetical protein [Paenibacillus sp. PDC88]|uniref:hypothetical protein n=1 Tax=Paenibacillus sp. PDC88 TaxID=1884375 RepID=UPI00089732F0|nr:hypothetical protein [Paenibacillus sp. PDC88]SDW30434.1 hypothetical protein SAMN05518848_101943 [Paenibacillus sp. PDC88]
MSIQEVAPSFKNPPTFQDLDEVKVYLKDAISKVARALMDIDFMINGTLDVNNIRAEGIEARSIAAEAITTEKIQAGAVTADKITVNELSAISANLGHIIAGLIESVEIYGSYIATRRNAYPRAEMSSDNDLFGAYRDALNFIEIEAEFGGSPAVRFIQNGQIKGNMHMLYGDITLEGLSGVTLRATGGRDILLDAGSGYLSVPSFSKIISDSDQSLGVELDRKATAGTSTSMSGSHNHGIEDGTELLTADGRTVTFRAAPQHSHSQNS